MNPISARLAAGSALSLALSAVFSSSALAQSVPPATAQKAAVASPASSPAKRPLTHNDFDTWRVIATPVLSRDGQWLAYSVQPQDGDGELVVKHLSSGKEFKEGVGKLPPPPTTPNEENPEAPPTPRAIRVLFTSDGQYLLATTFPTKAEALAARKTPRRPDEPAEGGLLIMDLNKGTTQRVAGVKSVQVPTKGGAWVAYLKGEPKPAAADAPKDAATPAPAPTPVPPPPPKDGDDNADGSDQAARRPASATPAQAGSSTTPRKEYGTDLILRNLVDGSERTIANVLDYALSRDGKTLLFTVSSRAETDNGVYSVSTGSTAAPTPLLIGKGKYLKLTWDREQTQAAWVSDRDDAAAKQPRFKLYRWARGMDKPEEIPVTADSGTSKGMDVSDKGTPAFSRDGKKLYVPVAAPQKPAKAPDAQPPEEERVTADLWRWNDDYVQSIQKARAAQERNRTYRGVWDIAAKRYTQLADEAMRLVSLSDHGTRAAGADDRAYRRLTDFDGTYTDIYLVDPVTGARRIAIRKLRDSGNFQAGQWSPDGKWLLYYQDKHWHLMNTADGKSRNVTASIKRAFHNEDQDTPGPKGSYGNGGWLSDSSGVLVYDRYDVWRISAADGTARNITQDVGRQANIRLRVQSIEPVDPDDDERGINPAKPLVLRGESEVTRASGFFSTAVSGQDKPTRLSWGDHNQRYVGRALDADVLLMTASRFDTFPELQVTNSKFESPKVVTNVGEQMNTFQWGTASLMPFRNAKGVLLQATLYKPANFDPKKKYPLMVYIYERLSQNVHNFVNPAPSQNVNPALYASNGYVILMPDIVYTAGQPGKDAMDAVLPAVDAVVKQGFIDEKAIGIQGHSWGGYQIAWMVTQTDRFRAAEAGAPVGNMTSAYSGIRWGTGLPRQFQYEQGQSRIGKNLQESREAYIANSPVFHIRNVKTPLLILHNDADDAVPWYQGVELFLALRRHGKEAYYFNYNGALHGLRRRADQKDYGLRMNQFFDHFLKGAPAPEWMTKGIPFLDREDEKERFAKLRSAEKSGSATEAAVGSR